MSESVWASGRGGERAGGRGRGGTGDLHRATDLTKRAKPPPPETAGLGPTDTRTAVRAPAAGPRGRAGGGGRFPSAPARTSGMRGGGGGETTGDGDGHGQHSPVPLPAAQGTWSGSGAAIHHAAHVGPISHAGRLPWGRKGGGGGGRGNDRKRGGGGGPLPLLRKRNQSTVKDAALPSRKDIAHSGRDCM